ncbi:MAG: leucine-rich repeat protein [Prevotella sp.]|nr:leucine-rich repeat protein [Prevotella sp.]
MQYPLISEYLAAIREAKDNLDKLSHLVPVMDKYGEPYRSSGAFAVVFKMKDEQTGKCYALKCFTEEQEGRAEAYRKIAEELEFVDSPYIISVKYLEKEIFVDSNCENEEFPVLLMDWIEGETMETYIAANYTDTHAMSMLCYRFCKMAAWLRSQSFAHGDIKPDNIMVRPDGTLTLVDYDGMFVPAMKDQKSPTIGTKDFSHPLRTIDDFDETIDDFALASIALSLKAISLNPSLLQTYGASDRLLFSAADYLDLSKSNTFTALQGLLADEEARTLLSMFLLASAKKDLSMCSFRLFGVQKPKEEEVWSTEVTKEDLENAVEDEFGVKYSKDWKRLLKAPSGLKGEYSIRKGVKVIGNKALGCCTSLTNINIPNSVTNIGDEAFSWCYSLTSIKIPNSVTNIGDEVFYNCSSLTSIKIPNSVTNIGNHAFHGCTSLTSINIPNSVTKIGDGAFRSCGSLISINIPNSVTNIGNDAFSCCDSLTKIIIPCSVVNMNGNPFCGWNGDLYNESKAFIYEHQVLFNKDKTILVAYRSEEKNYIIPNSVTNIGDSAFMYCKSLTNINIPNSVTNIGDEVFKDCRSLTNINIPDSVTNIGDWTFLRCTFLTKINIPDSVTNIGNDAFYGCISLASIKIPNSVTNIGNYAFAGCKSLAKINIPNSVTNIGYDAFWGCESLTKINIPNSVTNIGDRTFNECTSLTNINIPDSVTNIGYGAFFACESLTKISIPNSVTNIGNDAFYGCNNLPSKIKSGIIKRFGEKVFES